MAKFISILVLLLWAAATAATVLLFNLNGRALYARLGKLLFGAAWPADA